MNARQTPKSMDASLIDFMMQPDAYPHKPDEVTHVQTHISHVFIAGAYVYKLKKPVNFEFLDFSTPEKRKHYCHQEVKLNRRLTDDIYLGVVSISRSGGTYRLESGDPEDAVEYAVKMRRLPREYFLHTFIEEDKLANEHLDRIADTLTGFYRAQEPDEEILQWGRIENIKYNTDENFRQTKPFIGVTIDKNSWQAIRRYTNAYFEQEEARFNRRVEEKRIVDGHGDLHMEHIHIAPDAVNIYDCIEFNERFRYGDVAADLAFLAMDLDFNDCRKEGRYFIEQMAERLKDEDLLRHINFYKSYRAFVKGKVKSMQSGEPEVGEKEQQKARETATAYFQLALQYALVGSTPTVLVVMGRPATGKSTIAEQLSKKLNIDRFISDRIRKTLAGLPLNRRPDSDARKKLYAPEMTTKTYRRMMDEAGKQISRHRSLILDATYSKKEERDNLIKALQNKKARYYFVEAYASDDTIKKRLREREVSQNNVSDARLEDFEKLDHYYESPSTIDSDHLIRVDTEKPVEYTLEKLYRELIKQHFDIDE